MDGEKEKRNQVLAVVDAETRRRIRFASATWDCNLQLAAGRLIAMGLQVLDSEKEASK